MDYTQVHIRCTREEGNEEEEEAQRLVPEDESIVFLSKFSSRNKIKIDLGSGSNDETRKW